MENTIPAVYAKLLKVQSALKAPKGQYNSFGKYKYRSCEDIVEAAKPLCVENNLLLSMSDEIIYTEGRFYIKARASVTDVTDGSKVEVCAFARESDEKKGMDSSQVTGTASTYARKYALNGLFAIDDTKDADTDEVRNQSERGGGQSAGLICSDCRKVITDGKKKNGEPWAASDIASHSYHRYGVQCCLNCMNKRYRAQRTTS